MFLAVLGAIGEFVLRWYWVFLPFLLWPIVARAWLWYRKEFWEQRQEYVYYELIPPAEVLRPFQAMEQVLAHLWGIHSNLRGWKNIDKRWWKGRRPPYFTLEVVSVGPHPHLLIRCNRREAARMIPAFYSQFTDMQIQECPDYISIIPATVPTAEWDMFGVDMELIREDPYPIKTYTEFFEPKPETVKEERRIDPLNALLEGLAVLRDGEIMWIQMRLEPVIPGEHPVFSQGRKLIEKLAFRQKPPKQGLVGEMAQQVLPGPSPDQRVKEKAFVPTELKLTPRERSIVEAVEKKLGKQMFSANIRYAYFAKRNLFTKDHARVVTQYFHGFSQPDMNGLKERRRTKTKGYFYLILINRFLYLRKRRMLRRYLMRETSYFPQSGGSFALNTEEVATLFHLPFAVEKTGTYLPRIRSRRGEEPGELPVTGETTGMSTTGAEDYYRGDRGKGEGAPPDLPLAGESASP